MSKRDARKALSIRLPDELRLRLVKLSTETLPLAYLTRQALIRAFRQGLKVQAPVAPGDLRPILLQLSCKEREQLATAMASAPMSEEEAVLSLISQVI